MAIAAIGKTVPRVLWILGSHNGSFNTTVSDDRVILEEIQRALIETESELVKEGCEAMHPLIRIPLLAWSADLTSGDNVPAHLGPIEDVQIKLFSAASGYVAAEKTSRSNITKWRENYNNVFDAIAHDATGSSLGGFFDITNHVIEFTGYRAQVKTAVFVPDYSTPAHQINNVFEGGLVAGAILRLAKLGLPAEVLEVNGKIFSAVKNGIKEGAMVFPDISVAQKVNA